ncbi:MAG: ATP-binding protein [Burkholderiales bacterium]
MREGLAYSRSAPALRSNASNRRMRRGMLYSAARREGCNVLALAQHLDDFAETLMMSAMFGERLRTMRAQYVNDDGGLRVVRPFVYVRERQTHAFAKSTGLPVIAENCPACFAMPMQCWNIKQKPAQWEGENRQLFPSLLTAMRPLLTASPRDD